MPFKLYKPGQGYWTRTLSAIGAGVLVVGGVAWIGNLLTVLPQDWVILLQSAIAIAMVAVFGWLIYRWVGSHPRSCDFLIATEGEMKKVNWPTRREIIGSTWVVIGCVLILMTVLFLADGVFGWFFREIGIIDVGAQQIDLGTQEGSPFA